MKDTEKLEAISELIRDLEELECEGVLQLNTIDTIKVLQNILDGKKHWNFV